MPLHMLCMYHHPAIYKYISTSLNCIPYTNVCKICTSMQTDQRCLLLDKNQRFIYIFPYGRLTMIVRGIENYKINFETRQTVMVSIVPNICKVKLYFFEYLGVFNTSHKKKTHRENELRFFVLYLSFRRSTIKRLTVLLKQRSQI